MAYMPGRNQKDAGKREEEIMQVLRPYQEDAVSSTLKQWETVQSTIGVAGTGLGKTSIFAELIRRTGKRAIILAHRNELVHQAAQRLTSFGVTVDIEKAELRAETKLWGRAQAIVATPQTLFSGKNGNTRMKRFNPSEYELLIIDECHHFAGASKFYETVKYFTSNPNLRCIGVTATPDRADGIALSKIFQSVAFDIEITNGIDWGYLVPIHQQFVRIEGLDFSACRVTAGDLNGADLARVMEMEKTEQGVADATINICGDKRTLVFTASVQQAETLCGIFNRHKKDKAEWLYAGTPAIIREEILQRFKTGKTQIVTNCGILTEGYDNPAIECVVMARPTKSRCLYCLDEETEILGPLGWFGIDDPSRHAYAYHSETGAVITSRIEARTSRELAADEMMYGIDGRHMNIAVTANHRMLLRHRRGRNRIKRQIVIEAGSIPSGEWEIPVCGQEDSPGISLTDDEIRFIGLVMTDGNISKHTNAVTLYQSERYPECIKYIESVISGCGFKFGKPISSPAGQTTNYGIRKHALHRWTVSKGRPRGRDKHLRGWGELELYIDKELSLKMEAMTRRQLLILIEAMNIGDGAKFKCPSITYRPRTMSISTSRRALANNLQSLCVRRNIRCTLGNNGMGQIVMQIDPTRQWMALPTGRKDVAEKWGRKESSGRVWCVQVSTGFILCRRHGKVFVTGNSQMLGRGTRPLPGVTDAATTDEERRQCIADSIKPHLIVLDFVGNSGRHSLVTAADILGGKTCEEAKALARKRIEEKGESADVRKELKEAEIDILREIEEAKKRNAAEKAHLVGKATFSATYIDPFSSFQRTVEKYEGHVQRRLSMKQRNTLALKGYDPDRMTVPEALAAHWECIRATDKQRSLLYRFYPQEDVDKMPRWEAGKIITAIANNGWKKL